MTTNRLTKIEPGTGRKLHANEWAAIAREKGLHVHARAWDARAEQLGEPRIPDGITVKFDAHGQTYRVPIR